MAYSLRGLGLALAGASLLFLAACGQSGTQTGAAPGANQTAGQVVFHRGNGAEPKSLDPHHAEGTWESAVIGELMMGLLAEDPKGDPIPGAAESWSTSDDGLTWTFILRDHQWSDGRKVTADDFVFAWRRILTPATAAQYASLLYLFKNAEAVNAGRMPPDALGATAVDERTLRLELEHPAPYITELMTHQTTYPVPRHQVEAKGEAWTRAGDYVGNGPYVLREWIPNDHITVEKNPLFYDAQNVSIDRVVFYPTTDSDAALRRFRALELDVQDPLPASQIDWLRANMPDAVEIGPYLGVGYIVTNQTRKPFDDVRVREALNLAYDRETVATRILRLGQEPAYSFVPPGVANYPQDIAFSFKDMPYDARIARAQMLMRAAGYGPNNTLRTTYAISTSPDARRVAAAVQQMWRQIYVEVELVQSEVQVNYLKLQQADFDIGGAGWVADFNDARNFLMLLISNDNGMNYGRYKNPRFDELLNQSDQEPDAEKRAQLMAEAERLALADFAWIPTLNLVTTNLVHPYVKGWVPNIRDSHRTRWLSIDQEIKANTRPQ